MVLKIKTLLVEQLMKISQFIAMYFESLYCSLLNQQIEKVSKLKDEK